MTPSENAATDYIEETDDEYAMDDKSDASGQDTAPVSEPVSSPASVSSPAPVSVESASVAVDENAYGGMEEDDDADLPPVMSLADVKTLIAQKHGYTLDDNDPVLMMHTLHEGFVLDLERVLARRNEEVERVISKTGTHVADTVRDVLGVFKDEALKHSLQNTLEQVSLHAREVAGMEATIMRQRRLFGIFTAINSLTAIIIIAAGWLVLT